jgi:hypothetical protein
MVYRKISLQNLQTYLEHFLLHRATIMCYEIKLNLFYILSQFSIFTLACLSNNRSLTNDNTNLE